MCHRSTWDSFLAEPLFVGQNANATRAVRVVDSSTTGERGTTFDHSATHGCWFVPSNECHSQLSHRVSTEMEMNGSMN